MKFRTAYRKSSKLSAAHIPNSENTRSAVPRSSVVQVSFPGHRSYAYYNDRFDLHVGDIVYVDGKLEGQRGRVTEVNYTFKIRLSDYKQVIALVDTSVNGQFYHAGPYFITFDRSALPAEKAVGWFRAPVGKDEVFVSGSDGTSFSLDEFKDLNIPAYVFERGHDYYDEGRVVYISLDGSRGYAIVEGSTSYEIEFEYCGDEVSSLTCSCFCVGYCKHEVAAMLQLSKILETVENNYLDEYERSGYFAAIKKETLLNFAVSSRDSGTLVL